MKHEIDDTDIKILKEVAPFNDTYTSDDDIHRRIEPPIGLDELHDRLDSLKSDYGFVEIIKSAGAEGRPSWKIQSNPRGRQYLRDRDAKQAK